jgi:hypothetical protein
MANDIAVQRRAREGARRATDATGRCNGGLAGATLMLFQTPYDESAHRDDEDSQGDSSNAEQPEHVIGHARWRMHQIHAENTGASE